MSSRSIAGSTARPVFSSGSVVLCGALGLLLSFVAMPPAVEDD